VSIDETFKCQIILLISFARLSTKLSTKCCFLFLDNTIISTEVENEVGFDRDVGGEDELGMNEDQPHTAKCFC